MIRTAGRSLSGGGDILLNGSTIFNNILRLPAQRGYTAEKSKPTPLSFLVGDGAVPHQLQWISGTAVGLPAYATPLSEKLINRHRCRVISKRHRCRSDTDLATPLSGGCSVSAVIQSKNFRHRCRVFCSVTSVSQSSCYPLKSETYHR